MYFLGFMQNQHSSKMIQLENLNETLTPNVTWSNFTLREKGDLLDCTNVCINLLQQKCIVYTLKVICVNLINFLPLIRRVSQFLIKVKLFLERERHIYLSLSPLGRCSFFPSRLLSFLVTGMALSSNR